ncbi:MAG: oligopeptide transporter, OPT family [candidate division Zixibacteria bacterium]|nr:oligopeptide transporter, OPT family [candidate division Zixibacteria bacterium]
MADTPPNNNAAPEPIVGAQENIAEFTIKSLIAGIFFGVLFGAANTYLGLKAGLTVSTSIPVAVMTVTVFRALRMFGSRSTILESNMSQTIGSASSSLASGVIFTIPALFLWRADPSLLRISLLALLGGVLGIAIMIPLRKFLIVREHHNLPYPEGTACAEVLNASEGKKAKAGPLFAGLGIGALYKFCLGFLHLWNETPKTGIVGLPKAQIGIEATPALLGVGFILGPRIGAVMVAGAAISWVIIIPILNYIWGDLTSPVFPETVKLVSEMTTSEIWTRYIRYLGAGAVAMAGIITIIRSVPTMVESFKLGVQEIAARRNGQAGESLRTQRDLSMKTVGIIVGLIGLAVVAVPGLVGGFESIIGRIVVAIAIIVFAFFFVTVSSRIVGLIGVSSNPTSGMTIVTLLGTSFVFYAMGWTDMIGQITALSVGTVVCVAASIAGDTSQDLKTGFLVGATPYKQQIGEFIGAMTSTWAVAYAVSVLHHAYGFGSTHLPAPQATLMKTVIEGVLAAEIPWTLVGIGAAFALVVEAFKIPSLPFAVGLYLPVSTMTPIFAGGLVRWLVDKRLPKGATNPDRDRGVLYASGFIGGEGLIGVGLAAWTYFVAKPGGIGDAWAGPFSSVISLLLFVGLAWVLWRRRAAM